MSLVLLSRESYFSSHRYIVLCDFKFGRGNSDKHVRRVKSNPCWIWSWTITNEIISACSDLVSQEYTDCSPRGKIRPSCKAKFVTLKHAYHWIGWFKALSSVSNVEDDDRGLTRWTSISCCQHSRMNQNRSNIMLGMPGRNVLEELHNQACSMLRSGPRVS